jgi:amidase
VFARSVEDISLIASVCVPDSAALAPDQGSPPYLAFVKSPYWSRCEPPQRRCIEAAIQSFTAAGAQVEHIELPPAFDLALDAINHIQRFELFRLHGNRLEEWRHALSRQFLDYMESGRRITVHQYREALAYRDQLIVMYDEIVGPFSAVITPPANGEAPEGLATTGDATFCVIWTLCGAPAISLPSGFGPHGLPLGIQLVGHRHHDGSLLQTALWCEATLQRSQRAY